MYIYLKKHFSISIVLVFLISTLFYPMFADAAQVFLETAQTTMGVGQRFEVSVYVDSKEKTVNAFSGIVTLPSFVAPLTIRDGNSLVALWSNRPAISENDISFAGIIPGGWKGSRGHLFSFIADASSIGSGEINLSEINVLLNDGKGTPDSILFEVLPLNVDRTTPVVEFVKNIKDDEPPEIFKLNIGHNDGLFSGDAFVVFTAQDKGSGIDHYEILETKNKLSDEIKGKWEYAKSPYRLQDQSLRSFIYVRAFDRTGNVRVSVYTPQKPKQSSSISTILTIFLLFIIVIFFIRKIYIRNAK